MIVFLSPGRRIMIGLILATLTLVGCSVSSTSDHSAAPTPKTSISRSGDHLSVADTQAHAPTPPPGSLAQAKVQTSLKPPPMLVKLQGMGGLEVEKHFDTQVPGLTAWLVKKGGRYSIVYGTDNGYLIAGAVISPTGQNLTTSYQKKYAPKPDFSKMVGQIEADKYSFTLGKGGPLIYAFVDPNCIFCHKFEEAAHPLVKAGKLRVRYILVGFLKSDSRGRAAAILTAEDQGVAMDENREKYRESVEEGGIPPDLTPPPDVMQALQTHMNWMQSLGSSGTPTLIFKKGGEWTVKSGFPGDSWVKNYAASGHGA